MRLAAVLIAALAAGLGLVPKVLDLSSLRRDAESG
jgi:hypothetical protein